MSDSEEENNMFTVKPKGKKREKPTFKEEKDLGAVPPHIMRIMQQVDDKKKSRKQVQADKVHNKDSIAILRKMMGSMRTKHGLDDADPEDRMDRENDIARISNARDIFKQKEALEQGIDARPAKAEKHKRVEVNADFMLDGRNKAEELRQQRLKEMATMRAAREIAMDDEEMWNRENKQKSDEIKKQRELEIDMMRMARQQAMEEEERMMAMERSQPQRAISPSLVAAKNVCVSRDFMEEGDRKVEQLRQEREREIREMKRARELEMEDDDEVIRDCRSEAARELEAFRASRGGGSLKERYHPEEDEEHRQNGNGFTKAPKSRGKSTGWMVNASQDKVEQARLAREREMEMMMVARGQAIEEEETERMQEEMMRRAEAEHKAKEMAILVADLQRMRSETARDAEEEERMTRYQEEMLTRVMELHQIAKGGMMA